MRYLVFETALGHCAVAYRVKPVAIVRTSLPQPKERLLAAIGTHPVVQSANDPRLQQLANSMHAYFDKPPHCITIPWDLLDMTTLTCLQRAVLNSTAAIPFGQTRAYRDIAAAIDRPRAYRFVGTTLAQNPFPLVIPCHRVIRSDGSTGRFGGGTELKETLLDLESSRRTHVAATT